MRTDHTPYRPATFLFLPPPHRRRRTEQLHFVGSSQRRSRRGLFFPIPPTLLRYWGGVLGEMLLMPAMGDCRVVKPQCALPNLITVVVVDNRTTVHNAFRFCWGVGEATDSSRCNGGGRRMNEGTCCTTKTSGGRAMRRGTRMLLMMTFFRCGERTAVVVVTTRRLENSSSSRWWWCRRRRGRRSRSDVEIATEWRSRRTTHVSARWSRLLLLLL